MSSWSENNKASNCSSGLLYFCLLCSNLRHFRTTHCFTVKWKSALDCTFLVQLFENLPFFAIANGFVKRIHVKIPRLNGFRFIRIVKQQFFDRFGICWLIFWRWFQIQSIFLKKYSVYSTFCLHFTQFLLNSFESLTQFACLGLCSTQFSDFQFSLTL